MVLTVTAGQAMAPRLPVPVVDLFVAVGLIVIAPVALSVP
jgi:hypothetical protein